MIDPSRYPKKGNITAERGVNLTDRFLDLNPTKEAIALKNMYWKGKTLLKRGGFRRYSTEDFTLEGAFQGGHVYQEKDGTERLLFASNSGKIIEWLTASSSAERVTGLNTSTPVYFENSFNSVIASNGIGTPKIGRSTTWEDFGAHAAVSNLATAASGSGALTGKRYYIVVPVTEVSGVAKRYGDWSNIANDTAASEAQFDLTWTDVVDSRITHYYIFRSKDDLGTPFFFVAKVAAGVQAYTDSGVDADLSSIVSPLLGKWGVPPLGKYIVRAGNRNAVLRLDGAESDYIISQPDPNSYDGEGFPSDNQFSVPGPGPITGGVGIGISGETSSDEADLMIFQENATYIHKGTNPDLPQIPLSNHIGALHHLAIAQWQTFVFFQSRRGVEFWPGSGETIYLISDKIAPLFDGGGNQSLTKNQSDTDITYKIWDNNLLITVRDDSGESFPNKVYGLDLLEFQKNFDPVVPSRGARFFGPWEGPSFGRLVKLSDETLICFDSENIEILKLDDGATQDSINGTDTNIGIKIEYVGLLSEEPLSQKILNYIYLLQFSTANPTVTVTIEFDKEIFVVPVTALNVDFDWDDIVWDDIDWTGETWLTEGYCPYGRVAGKWFKVKIEDSSQLEEFAHFGLILGFFAFKQNRVFR